MIKGVNKRIIEVMNPEDDYFEKIILFVNPKIKSDEQVLNTRVDSYLESVVKKVKRKKKIKQKLYFGLGLLCAASAGGIVVSLLSFA